MAWSTREIAELAGTTVRAVRHYHQVGLLDEPVRRANGYKQYGVAHLVRVLRIKRLIDLGFSLAQISAMGDAAEHPEQALRTLDAELAGTIDRLERVRLELALIMNRTAPADLPSRPGPATGRTGLSGTDRSLVVVLAQVLGPRGLQAYSDLLHSYQSTPEAAEFDRLPADAGEQIRDELARRLHPHVQDLLVEHPGILDLDVPAGAQRTVGVAVLDLYNPAQIDVMRRVALLGAAPDRA
ncbi:MerR family transcriptional regulator [Amycolatopsis sp. NBC_01480]|uniref:MerR family transcriptional regulator n=1 Tax=Amycolatopsis sp. NBC_01480 TaxID=2903562 RepID=UPI002E29518E|nr:MerR family transcriptional regulator [Amycolatopsis sp. NBC_01480]